MNESHEEQASDPRDRRGDSGTEDASTELQALQQERAQLEEKLRRTLADAANMRRRQQQEAEESRRRIVEGYTHELLPVLDNFSLALQSWDEQTDKADPAALVQGVKMVQMLLLSLLERHGLQEIQALGEVFDPARHEAVAVEPSDEIEQNRIVRVLMTGYLLGDRVLRHAKVVVAGPNPAAGDQGGNPS